MQKVIAAALASLLLFPAGSFAQEYKVNDGSGIGQSSIAPMETLRESAIRQARLAVMSDATAQASNRPSWPSRHPVGFGALIGLGVGATWYAIAGGGAYLVCTGDEGGLCVPNVLLGAGVGALWGTVAGLIVKAARD